MYTDRKVEARKYLSAWLIGQIGEIEEEQKAQVPDEECYTAADIEVSDDASLVADKVSA